MAVPAEIQTLSERQLARVAALRIAREVLAVRTPISSGATDPVALITVAAYIESAARPAIPTQTGDTDS